MKKIESFELVNSFGLISLEEAQKINGGDSIGACAKDAKLPSVLFPGGNIPVPSGNYISLEPISIAHAIAKAEAISSGESSGDK